MNDTNRRLLIDTAFRLIDDDPNCGFHYICDQGGVCSREEVTRLLLACQSHLKNLSEETINWNNQQYREEQLMKFQANEATVEKEPRFGFIYLMRNQRNGLTKIGFYRARLEVTNPANQF